MADGGRQSVRVVPYSTHINETDKGIGLVLAQLNSVHRNLELILYEKTQDHDSTTLWVFSQSKMPMSAPIQNNISAESNPLPINSPPAQPQTKIHLDHPSSLAELPQFFLAAHINKVDTLECVGCRTWRPVYRICTEFIHREKDSRMVVVIVQGEQCKQFPGTLPLSWSVASIGMRCPNWLLLSLLALVGWRHEQIN